MQSGIHMERQGSIATVVLNSPDKLNAMSRSMWRGLKQVFLDLQSDAAMRCFVVRGSEAPFCAGGDIAEYPGFRFDEASLQRFHEEEVWGALAAMLACDLPMVALIYGVCMGAGLEIASTCDLRLAADDAKFGASIARLGFLMAPREAALVSHAVGETTAGAMLLAAEVFSASHSPGLFSPGGTRRPIGCKLPHRCAAYRWFGAPSRTPEQTDATCIACGYRGW